MKFLLICLLLFVGCDPGGDARNANYNAQIAESELKERYARVKLGKLCCEHCITNPKLRLTLKHVKITGVSILPEQVTWRIVK